MTVRIAMEQEGLTFFLKGELDHHSTLSLREAMDEQLRRHRPQSVRIDLSETDFCDSSGLGLILGRLRVARELGARLEVASPSPRVKKILDLAGGERLFRYV